jgi:hypothetical protein
MGTPPDREGGWQSQWQQPQQPAAYGNWQRAPDGSWVQVGGMQTSGKATAALVLGILGLVLCPLICSVLALVFGYQARSEIDASGGRISGRGSATAGVVLGWVGVGIVVLFVLIFVIGIAAGSGTESVPSGPVTGEPA